MIAIDADREGEMIAREIIELCGYRVHSTLCFRALNDASIRKALDAPSFKMRPAAVVTTARSRADWLIA